MTSPEAVKIDGLEGGFFRFQMVIVERRMI
jgi:hypothetical protein